MAQNFTIPIQFSCNSDRRNCFRGKARVTSYERWEYMSKPAGAVNMTVYDVEGHTYLRRLQGTFLENDLKLLLAGHMDHKNSTGGRQKIRGLEIDVILCLEPRDPSRAREQVKINPWSARDEFLRLPRDPKALRDFLAQHGTWASAGWDAIGAPCKTSIGSHGSEVVIPLLVWEEQQAIRQALANSAKSWFSSGARQSEFELFPRSEFPHFVHVDSFCQYTIRNSVTLDFLRGIKFDICKRPDCAMPFERAHKGKIYCSQYCGHLVSLRKKRAGQK
jgi:hypothetical protein